MALLIWVIIGSIVLLVYDPFILGIDVDLAGKFWTFPLMELLIIFLWPILLLYLLARMLRGPDPH